MAEWLTDPDQSGAPTCVRVWLRIGPKFQTRLLQRFLERIRHVQRIGGAYLPRCHEGYVGRRDRTG